MTKYDVFYLLVVTSNVSSFGCLVEVVVMSHFPVLLVKGKSKRSAVNKIYTLAQKLDVLKYAGRHSESEAVQHFGIPRTTIQ